MNARLNNQNTTLHKAGSVLLSCALTLSLLMPNPSIAWAEENDYSEEGVSYELEGPLSEEEQAQAFANVHSDVGEVTEPSVEPTAEPAGEPTAEPSEAPAEAEPPAQAQAEPDLAPQADVSYPAFSQSVTLDDVIITLEADEGAFPEGAYLHAEALSVPEADDAVSEKRDAGKNVAASYTFDIAVLDEAGNELQPAGGQDVSVSFRLAEVADTNLDTDVWHVSEEAGVLSAEELRTKEDGDIVTAKTPGFSLFTVEFTYQELSYVMSGEKSVPLSEVLDAVGLTGTPEAALVSDESLFSVSEEGGAWTLTSHKPFDSQEWLKVTINGIVYEIAVTDAESTMDWAAAQAWIDGASDGDVLVLEADLIAPEGVGPLVVPSGKTVTIDLAGHSIVASKDSWGALAAFTVNGTLNLVNSDSGTKAVVTGSINNNGTTKVDNISFSGFQYANTDPIIKNNGDGCTLELKDCVITGNNIRSLGAVLYSNGGRVVLNGCEITNNTNSLPDPQIHLTGGTEAFMTDCVISGNTVTEDSGTSPAINVSSGAVLTIEDVTVTGNKAYANPGIFVDDDSQIKAEGKIVIRDNIQTYQGTSTYGPDLYLDEYAKLQITGPLDPDSIIGIESWWVPSSSRPDNIVLTEGLKGNGGLENFVYTNSSAVLAFTEDEDVLVGVPMTIDFLPNGGSGDTMPVAICPKNAYIKMPENGYTAPQGRTFLAWEYLGKNYQPGTLAKISEQQPVNALWGQNRWSFTQSEIDVLKDAGEGTILLTYDLIADPTDAALHVPTGLKLTLDLNGHTIDRHRENPEENGSAIINDGTLTIIDSAGGGTITGGKTTGNGGGILNNRSLYLNGGTISGNSAQGDGGGVYNSYFLTLGGGAISENEAGQRGGGVFNVSKRGLTISDGEITGNKAGVNAGGVWFEPDGYFGLIGSAVVTGNTVGDSDNNVYLQSGAGLTFSANFSTDSLVGVTTEVKPTAGSAVNVTKSNKGRSTVANFFSDDPVYGVFQELDDEVKLVVPITISFDKGHESATGEMASFTAGQGVDFTAPSNGYDLVGGAFVGWYANGDKDTIYKAGEKVAFDGDTVLTAAWDESAWKELQSKIDHAEDGETIVLDKPVTAASNDVALHVPADKNITIDLNGHTIDRNLSTQARHGYVIGVEGKLTIVDSAGGGTITGGNDYSTGAMADAAGGILVTQGELVLKSGTISGNSAGRGGGIHNHFGTVTIEGGTIENNTATSLGGGIDSSNGTTYLKGGTITNNSSGQIGGGIIVSTSTTYVSGSPVIKNNTGKSGNDNVYIGVKSVLNVDGPIGEDAQIHVFHAKNDLVDESATITNGFPGNATMDAFVSDEGYFKGYDANGELTFGKVGANVTFAYADGKIESITWPDYSYVPIPESDYEPIEGQTFLGWNDVNSDGEKMYQPNELAYVRGATKITETWSNPWVELQKQIDAIASQDEGTITLAYDVTAGPRDVALHVPAGAKLTLDLNGHTIDRKRQIAERDGSVFVNDGILTIVDSAGGGTITGGKTTGDGGGILNNRSLHLDGGTVTGNYAQGNGGGVYSTYAMSMEGGAITGNEAGQLGGGVYNKRTLTLYDATITDNVAGKNGGGVWFETSGLVVANGKVTITDNTASNKDNNVYLQDGMTVAIASRYDRESRIGVMTEAKPAAGSAVNVTKTNKGRSTAEGFISDDPAYGIFQELEDEVKLVVPITISFEKGNESATGEMAPVTAGMGIDYTAPSCGFDLVGGAFAGWYVNGDEETIVKPGEKLSFDADATFTATWDESAWKELQSKIDHAADGETIVLDKPVTAASDDVALRVPEGKNVTIDLNGYTIDRNLSEPVREGYVIRVDGKLTVKDSAGGGTITGGNDNTKTPSSNTGGGIHVEGEFVLQSGTISGNHSVRGGGIMSHYGTVTIEGGTIENNTATSLGGGIDAINGTTYIRGGSIINNSSDNYGGGIVVSPHDTYFSGSPVITGNTAKGEPQNVYATVSSVLNVDGPLGEGADIHVFHAKNDRVDEPVTITSGFPGNGTVEAFASDQGYYKGLDVDGELVFGKSGVTVTYHSGDKAKEEVTETTTWAKDSYVFLPECSYTPVDGYSFKGWQIGTELHQPEAKIKASEDIDITAIWTSPWRELQEQIDAAASGDTIVLSGNVRAGETDVALVVPAGKTLAIDLNGFMIDRHLDAAVEDGSVLVNNGILTIKNSGPAKGGKITGGNTTGNGGGIVNKGTLNLNAGVITGNKAEGNGGGIYNSGRVNMYGDAQITRNSAGQNGGGVFVDTSQSGQTHNFIMYGGAISENTAGVSGGGVFGDGFYHITGDSKIASNTVSGEPNNLYVSAADGQPNYEHMINSLSDGAYVGITSELKPEVGSPVTVVKRMTGDFSIKGLYSDDPAYTVMQGKDNEAQLAVAVTVTFDKGDPLAEGVMEPVKVPLGVEYTLPGSDFTLEDSSFGAWMVDDNPEKLMAPGDKLTPEKDVKLTAVWGSAWKELQDKINNAKNGDVIVLDEDVMAMPADVSLLIPAGKDITIDLNGHKLDRHLSEKKADGSVMVVNGTLTVTDSAGGGTITGAKNESGESTKAGSINVTGGTFILKGGSITGNYSFYSGGVHPANGGTFIMEGGSIENNEAWLGSAVIVDQGTVVDIRGGSIKNNESDRDGAVSVSSNGTLNISGNPVITDNTTRGNTFNVDIGDGIFNVTGELDESAKIGVFGVKDGVFTSGLPGRGTIENFSSDNERAIGYTQDGEAIFGPAVTVSFDANGGSGTMDSVKVAKDSYYILPKNAFTAPQNTSFDRWVQGTESYGVGAIVKISGDTVFKASWKDDPKANLTLHWSSGDGVDLKEPLTISAYKDSVLEDVIGREHDAITSHFQMDGYTPAKGDSEYGLFLPMPVSSYSSMAEATAAQVNLAEQLGSDMDLYYVLVKEQGEISLSLEAVSCGTDTAGTKPSVRLDSASNGTVIGATWINSADDHTAATGTLVGDQTAYVDVVLEPKPGIAFGSETAVTVDGGTHVATVINEDGTATVTVSALVAHTPGEALKENEREATCIEAGGYYENVYCTQDACGHTLLSSEFVETEPAMGHAWGEPTYHLSADKQYLIAERECEHQTTMECNEVEQAKITSTKVTKPATCEENGETTYTSAPFTNPAFTTQSITLADIEKTGHDWGEPTYTWADDNSTVTAQRVCKNDASHVETETVQTEVFDEQAPTCTEDGSRTYLALFTNKAFEQQIKSEAIPATGHDWGEPTYTWADDNSTVTAQRVCKNDAAHIESETVDTVVNEKAATCEEDGERTYTATFTNKAFSAQTKSEAIPATGHDWDEPTYTWSYDNSSVTAKRVCKNDATHIESEKASTTKEVTKPATCEEKGETTYSATFANDAFEGQTKTVADIDALGHNWDEGVVTKEATCTEDGVLTYTCKHDPSHTKEEAIPKTGHLPGTAVRENEVEATCTEAGSYDEVVYCENCGEELSRDHHTEPALGHDWGAWTVVKEATEDEDGLEERECARCHEVEERAIPHKDHVHEMVHVDEVPATCTTTGVKEHYKCEKCGRYFLDADGVTEVAYEDLVIEAKGHTTVRSVEDRIPATCTSFGHYYIVVRCTDCGEVISRTVVALPKLGHDWGEPTYTWSNDNGTVTAERVCRHDADHKESETVAVKTEVTKQPTCTEAGERTYTATFASEAFVTQTKTEAIPPTGHDWDVPTYTWAEDNNTVTAEKTCKNDSTHVVKETVNTTSSVTLLPTCTEPGETTYTAEFQDASFAPQSKTLADVDPLGHEYGDPVYVWAADNSTVTARMTCDRCGDTVEETAVVTQEIAKEPTCTEKGSTTYTAQFTNLAFETQTKTLSDIDATGHKWDAGTVTTKPTCEETGVMTYTCLNDPDHTYTEEIAALGHSPAEPVIENMMPATCTKEGGHDEVIRCERCGKVLSTEHHVDPALGHLWGEWKVVKEATEEEEGLEERVCSRCGEKETRPIPKEDHVHQMKHVDEVAATCTKTGVKEHYECEKCGRYFLDEEGLQEVEYEDLILPLVPHTTDRRIDNRVEPTCTARGHYEVVVYCTECGEVISRTLISTPPTGHKWGKPTYTWSADNGSVTAESVCEHDKSHVQSETVVPDVTVTKDPTCTEPGEMTYTAEFTNDLFETQTKTEEIPATGHDWDTPTYTWAGDNSTVTASKTCLNDPTETVTETVETSSKVTKEPTCTGKGEVVYTATFSDSSFKAQTKTVLIDEIGHDWDAPTYTWSEDNSAVTAQRVCKNDAAHVESETVDTVVSETPATCEEGGERSFTATFTNKAFSTQTKTEEIPATGHKPGAAVRENEIKATCTEPGSYDEVVYCENCGEELWRDPHTEPALGHEWGDWEVIKEATEDEDGLERRECTRCHEVEERSIPHKDHVHSMVHVNEVPATCTATGVKEHYECEKCSRYFLDEEGLQEVEYEALIIEPKGHTTVRSVEDRVPATCTRYGHYYIVVRCAECGEVISRTLVSIPPTGHTWGEPTYTWSEDNGTVTAQRVCENDAAHVESETVSTVVIETPATCEEDGERSYTATFTNEAFATQTKDETIPALGHLWGDWEVVKEPTAEAEGLEQRTCQRCGETQTRSIPKPTEISYRVVEGDGSSWTRGSSDGLTFRWRRNVDDGETFGHFTGIAVDGTPVDPSAYTAEPGSVIIRLTPGYLQSLSTGKHVLSATFDDGKSDDADFTIVEPKKDDTKPDDTKPDGRKPDGKKSDGSKSGGKLPKTGDQTPVYTLYAALALALMLLAAGTILKKE